MELSYRGHFTSPMFHEAFMRCGTNRVVKVLNTVERQLPSCCCSARLTGPNRALWSFVLNSVRIHLERSIEMNWDALDRWIEWASNFVAALKVYVDTFPHACSMPLVASLRWAEIIAPIVPFATAIFVHCYDGVVALKTRPCRVWWIHIARRSHRDTFFHPIGTSRGFGWDVWLGFLGHPTVSPFALFSFLFHLYVCVCLSLFVCV